MAHRASRLILPFLIAASIARTGFGQTPGSDPIGSARDLYASARYDEALAVLNDLRPDMGGPVDRKSIEQYRSLCLLALGRGTEAESAIAAVVTVDPSYLPGDQDASPRVRAAFSDVRKRVLPEIANSRYVDAKSAFDRKDYGSAVPQFRQVLALLDDPDMTGRLTDLRTLTSGFLELAIAAAAAPRPEAPKPAAAEPAAPAPAPVPEPPKIDVNKVYTIADTNVRPPSVIRQEVPRLQPMMKPQAKTFGVLEITIDEQGRVGALTVRQSIHPMYDAELLAKAKDWRYTPATMNGQPVRFRKLIQLNVSATQ